MKDAFRLHHYEYPDDMDVECIPLCDVFNSCGLTTKFSCCGHGKSNFDVIFDDDVSMLQMEEFISRFENQYTHSPFLGKFVMWMRKMSGKIVRNWMYTAPSKRFAEIDRTIIIKELNLADEN